MSQGAEGRGTGAGERIVAQVFIAGTPEAVWHEITKTDSVQKCMFDTQLHTRSREPGSPFAMRTHTGRDTFVVGEILEWDPPHRYAHTFRFTCHDDPPCKVIYELREVEGGVEFLLVAEDVPDGTSTAKQMRGGLDSITKTLKAVVETGRPPFGVRMSYALFRVLIPLVMPKRCRSENWPV